MSGYFDGKVCVVTGAASGIGLAVGEALLEEGATVVLADRDADRLASAATALGSHADRVDAVPVDVTSAEQVQRLIDDTVVRRGRLDVLFNNAGVGGTLPVGQATLEHWRRIVDLNLWGVIHGVHAVLPVLRRQGGGHIVNTASVAGLVPFPYQSLYCTTKYGVVGMSESLRLELAADNIRVSVVCPGNVVSRIFGTPILGAMVDVAPPPDAIPAAEAAQTILGGVAEGRGVIVFPDGPRELWRAYRQSPERAEEYLQDVARQRRAAYGGGDVAAVLRATDRPAPGSA